MPCGEYLWNHANASLREYLIQEFILGPTGLGNANVSGFYLDDGWSNTSAAILPWEPKEGFCDHSPIGGATEEDLYCTADMGLTQADTTAIRDNWIATIAAVESAIQTNGGFAWAMLNQMDGAPAQSVCASWFRGAGTRVNATAWMVQWTNASASASLPQIDEDLAIFLLARGPYAWIGYAWLGCTSTSVPGFGEDWAVRRAAAAAAEGAQAVAGVECGAAAAGPAAAAAAAAGRVGAWRVGSAGM